MTDQSTGPLPVSAPAVSGVLCAARPSYNGGALCFCAACLRRWPDRVKLREAYAPPGRLSAEVSTSVPVDLSRKPLFLNALIGECRPTRAGRGPDFDPPIPQVVWRTRAQRQWRYRRPWRGTAAVLDQRAAWLSALSSLQVAHGKLVRRLPGEPHWGKWWPGVYQVPVEPGWWDEAAQGMPCPVGRIPEDARSMWLPLRAVATLRELAAQDRWPAVEVLDCWTAEPVALRPWADHIRAHWTAAIVEHGHDSEAHRMVKQAMAQAVMLPFGFVVREDDEAPTGGDGASRPAFVSVVHRPDWTQAVWAQAAYAVWQLADDLRALCLAAGVEPPVMLRKTDEILLPADSLEAVRELPRPLLRLAGDRARPRGPIPLVTDVDQLGPQGIRLGTCRVKEYEEYTA